jgi:hypothetical protein
MIITRLEEIKFSIGMMWLLQIGLLLTNPHQHYGIDDRWLVKQPCSLPSGCDPGHLHLTVELPFI